MIQNRLLKLSSRRTRGDPFSINNSILSRPFKLESQESVNRYPLNSALNPLLNPQPPPPSKINFREGYIVYKSSSNTLFFAEKWIRVYMVLNQSDLFFYQTKEDYQMKPKQTIKNRPISVVGWVDGELGSSLLFRYIVQSFQGKKGELQISLTPLNPSDERRRWDFRVETMDELMLWSDSFERVGNLS